MDQRQRLEAQLAQHQANMMPRGVQSGIQPAVNSSSNGAAAAGPVPAAPAEADEAYEVSLRPSMSRHWRITWMVGACFSLVWGLGMQSSQILKFQISQILVL